jgi:hypothetical protein
MNEQATYTSDGEALMEPHEMLNHFARGCLQLIAYMASQNPMHTLLRVDRTKFLSAFSSVIDGIRTEASAWPMGPGWEGEDTVIGKDYKEVINTTKTEDFARLYNSDSLSSSPYGNEKAAKLVKDWERHTETWTKTIPLCVAADFAGIKDIEANPNIRRSEYFFSFRITITV